jgi:hypothetical protein
MRYQVRVTPHEIRTEKASTAARLHWCVALAKRLVLIDDDVIAMWCIGECTDRDVIEGIIAHGGLRDYHAGHSMHNEARALVAVCNELLGQWGA